MLPTTLSLFSFVLYLAATTVLGMRLRRDLLSLGAAALWLWLAALCAHAAALELTIFTEAGLDLAFAKAGSATALLLAAILLINCLRKPLTAIALFVLPLAAVLALAGNFSDHQVIVAAAGDTHLGIRLHILSSLLAYGVLGLAGAQAIVLHYQNRQLRDTSQNTGRDTGRGTLLRMLPPLDAMESFLLHLLMLGLMLLTLSLASGWIYHQDLLAQHLLHKTVLTSAAWLLFTILLTGHWFAGWRGERAVKLTLIGLSLLIVGYFGSKFVLEYILHRV